MGNGISGEYRQSDSCLVSQLSDCDLEHIKIKEDLVNYLETIINLLIAYVMIIIFIKTFIYHKHLQIALK